MSELDNINEMVDRIAKRRAARELLGATATALDEFDQDVGLKVRGLIDEIEQTADDDAPAAHRLLKKKQKARAKAKPAAAADDEDEDDEPDSGGGPDEKKLCDICCETALRSDNKSGICNACRKAGKTKKA